MALTIVVRGSGKAGDKEPSLTLDAPRVVLGRGDGCEVRLPDASVSHRHASLRQKGGGWVIVDEGSLNGTFVGRSRLSPQAPQPVSTGDLVRLGRVWIELRIEAALVGSGGAAAAKELALELVARSLTADGEEPGPRITVVEGPDTGAVLVLSDASRSYAIGRGRDVDLALTDANAGRRHVSLVRRGDALGVQDLGSPQGTLLDGAPLGAAETLWRPRQELVIASTRLSLDYPAAEALAEIERSPDERLRDGEVVASPSASSSEEPDETARAGDEGEPRPPPFESTEAPTPPPETALAGNTPEPPRAAEKGTWGAVDGFVILVALGVLAVSALGAFWLLGR